MITKGGAIMKILLHMCCGPCAVTFVDGLASEGLTPDLLWHNPNIHPFTEYRARKKAAMDFAANKGLILKIDDNYGLREFISVVTNDSKSRCDYCYRSRLQYTAKYAADNGFDAFSTTLLASPYQNFDAICRYGAEAAQEYGVEFIVRDFRGKFRDGLNISREIGLYMQKYCGCIFSEEERYKK
jgi:predicted adenine nucleotide alpha hydrolase (AANH) superfamily ATPase